MGSPRRDTPRATRAQPAAHYDMGTRMDKGIAARLTFRGRTSAPPPFRKRPPHREPSVAPVAGGERPRWMLSAQQRVVLIPFERSKACRWRQRNRRLPDAESPAESEDRTRLTPVDLHRDKTQESLGAPIQILARRACRGVEENWRKAEETERVSGLDRAARMDPSRTPSTRPCRRSSARAAPIPWPLCIPPRRM